MCIFVGVFGWCSRKDISHRLLVQEFAFQFNNRWGNGGDRFDASRWKKFGRNWDCAMSKRLAKAIPDQENLSRDARWNSKYKHGHIPSHHKPQYSKIKVGASRSGMLVGLFWPTLGDEWQLVRGAVLVLDVLCWLKRNEPWPRCTPGRSQATQQRGWTQPLA